MLRGLRHVLATPVSSQVLTSTGRAAAVVISQRGFAGKTKTHKFKLDV
jgi:hypothetical protein